MSTRPQLSGPIHAEIVDEPNELVELRERFSDMEERIDALETRLSAQDQFIRRLQTALAAIFSDAPMESSQARGVGQPIPSSAYDAWKQRLPPSCGRVIDALLVQPMGYVQLKNYCKMGASTLDQALAKLRANALIEKDGTLNRLKR